MILAAPLVIPFAKAVGISVATLGMAKAADMVNDYIEANPEESMKILSTIVPSIGIGQIFMNKEKIILKSKTLNLSDPLNQKRTVELWETLQE